MALDISVGILTVSDSRFLNPNQDLSGPQLCEAVKTAFPDYKIEFKTIVPDDKQIIIEKLNSWISSGCNLILTTGGTGFSPRDVTPEATRSVIEREAPGLSYAMISKSLAITPMAMLSRAVCGIKDKSIVINLPGSVKGALECFSFVRPALLHAIALVMDHKKSVVMQHSGEAISPSRVSLENLAERPRKSTYEMMEVDEALQLIIQESTRVDNEVEQVNIENALYRVLAENIESHEDLPQFDASIKDGYAVITADGDGIRKVYKCIAAGDYLDDKALEAGYVIRICTGAPIPKGADAVVQIEDTSIVKAIDGEEVEIKINIAPKLGQDIRFKGCDMKAGELVFSKGIYLKSPQIGVLASLGKSRVLVYKKPSVGILSTGNELRNHNEVIEKGQIRDSNRLTLINLLKQHHFNCEDHGIVKDDPNALKFAISKALSTSDILITTGGVSMGEFDFIKRILIEDFNAKIHFGRVNMKPGKPTTFATLVFKGATKLIFGLPGNPVSAGVTTLLFVVPLLKFLENATKWTFTTIPYAVSNSKNNVDPRPEYVRVVVTYEDGKIVAASNGYQISSRLNSLAGANGLLLMPGNMEPNKEYMSKIILIDELL